MSQKWSPLLRFSLGILLITLTSGKRIVCSGSANGMGRSLNSVGKEIQILRDLYQNCTLVTGNLEILGVTPQHLEEANITSLDFLANIEEVIGYVLIAYSEIESISLPKLKIIRGESLFTNVAGDKHSLLVFHNPKLNEINFPSLRVIQSGSVKVLENPNLCYWNTIDWEQMVESQQIVEIQDNFTHCRYRSNFSEACRQCSNPHCWGPDEDQCQIIYRNGCPNCSNRMCYEGQCCDVGCAGGCTGPRRQDCVACLDFRMGNICVPQCPSPTKYNAVTKVKERNPHGMYHLSHECVRECPKNMVIDADSCVSRCSEGFTVKTFERSPGVTTRECVQCEKFCPKTCVITDKVSIENIYNFTNCTVVDGFIEIRQNAFSDGNHTTALTAKHLMELSSVQMVTQYIFIQLNDPTFKSLRFLKNLERIEGRGLFKGEFALYISYTSLESLDLINLKEIMAGSLYMNGNSQLCYVHNIPWERIVAEKTKKYKFEFPYQEPSLCQRFNTVCDPRCNITLGCWGPLNDSCYECKVWKLDGICTDTCLPSEGRYIVNETAKACGLCHSQCKDGCSGPLTSNCYNCAKVRQDGECVDICREGYYHDKDNVCQPCNSACDVQAGCTGPLDKLGLNGCNKCYHGLLTEDGGSVENCLPREAIQSSKCVHHQSYFVHYPDSSLVSNISHMVCKKCHSACRSCSGFGTHMNHHGCKCAKLVDARTNTSCLEGDDCPHETYAFPFPFVKYCFGCPEECDGCWKFSNESCKACKNFKIANPMNQTRFICAAECPPDRPQSDPHRVCMAPKKTFNKEQITKVAGAIAGVFLLILIVSFSVIYYYRKRWVEKQKAEEIEEYLDKPLPPSVNPNLNQLNIISEMYLNRLDMLGSGAFGAVYKGTYSPPEVNGKKLPVAIKVIRDENKDASAIEEMLEEAKIMASMEHRNLVRLVGICIGSEVMLVTPLMALGSLLEYVAKNRAKITSKTLLTWGQQIADGMAYLEENRLVHRDLAARNVLVKKPWLVKITDFGLAKMLDLGESSYKSRGGKVPVKWLAIESIKHGQFTHQSDVWAFGVTMWELFTFGERPYADVHIEDVLQILEKGERLPQPAICSLDVFLIIVKCWMKDPQSRPHFTDLSEAFARMRMDSGRYLVIPGENDSNQLLRLESYTVEDNKRRLLDQVDLNEDQMIEEEDLYRDDSEPNSPSSPSKPLLDESVERRLMPNFNHRSSSTGSQRYGPEPRRKQSKNSKATSHINDADNYLMPNTLIGLVPESPGSSTYVPYTTVISASPSEADGLDVGTPHEYYNETSPVSEYLTPKSVMKLANGRLSSTSSCGFDNSEYLQSPADGSKMPSLLQKRLLPSQFFDETFMEKESTV